MEADLRVEVSKKETEAQLVVTTVTTVTTQLVMIAMLCLKVQKQQSVMEEERRELDRLQKAPSITFFGKSALTLQLFSVGFVT